MDEINGVFIHKLGYIFVVVGDSAQVTAWGHTTAMTRAEAREWWRVADGYATYLRETGQSVNTSTRQHVGRW